MLGALVLLLVGLVACTNPGGDAYSVSTERRIFTPDELDVGLDPSGRPYDANGRSRWADRVFLEELDQLFIPSGSLHVMDGNAIQVSPSFLAEDEPSVVFDSESLDASAIWEEYDDAPAVLSGKWDGRAVLGDC